MTLPIAREHARYGIRAVTIAPGISGMPGMAGLPQDLEDTPSRTVPSRRASAVRLKTPTSSCTPARIRC